MAWNSVSALLQIYDRFLANSFNDWLDWVMVKRPSPMAGRAIQKPKTSGCNWPRKSARPKYWSSIVASPLYILLNISVLRKFLHRYVVSHWNLQNKKGPWKSKKTRELNLENKKRKEGNTVTLATRALSRGKIHDRSHLWSMLLLPQIFMRRGFWSFHPVLVSPGPENKGCSFKHFLSLRGTNNLNFLYVSMLTFFSFPGRYFKNLLLFQQLSLLLRNVYLRTGLSDILGWLNHYDNCLMLRIRNCLVLVL